MTAPDPRIVLLGSPIGLADDLIVDHSRQPADYAHTDGTVWTWRQRWRLVGGFQDDTGGTLARFHTHLRAYDLADAGTDSN